MRIATVILLAGKSERFVADTPKQFFCINSKPLIYYTISSFEKVDMIDEITLVTAKEFIPKVKDIVKQFGFKKVTKIVEGGASRSESSKLGIKSLDLSKDDIVLIHDGARPLVSEKVILDLVEAVKEKEAATTAIKMEDTVAISKDGQLIESFEDRENYYRIQTPQGFKYKTIVEAQESMLEDATDDAQLVKALGKEVALVLGDKRMNKITTIEDIAFLEKIIENEHL